MSRLVNQTLLRGAQWRGDEKARGASRPRGLELHLLAEGQDRSAAAWEGSVRGEPGSILLLTRPWAPRQPLAPKAPFLPGEGTVDPQPSPLPTPSPALHPCPRGCTVDALGVGGSRGGPGGFCSRWVWPKACDTLSAAWLWRKMPQ